MFIYAILILLPALGLAAKPLTSPSRHMFKALDANKDGSLSKTEIQNYFSKHDLNKDGSTTKSEFSAAINKLDPVVARHEDALYALFDRDASGSVNKKDSDAVFALTDANKDKSISKYEFHIVLNLVITHIG